MLLHGNGHQYAKSHFWPRCHVQKASRQACVTNVCRFLEALEQDLSEVWDHPLPVVAACLTKYDTDDLVFANLPDIELPTRRMSLCPRGHR